MAKLPSKIARLDRPQRWGVLPTMAFWNRRDVWRIAGLPCGVFAVIWVTLLSNVVGNAIPMWASLVLSGLGPLLFLAVLERGIRKRLRLAALTTGEGTDTDHVKPA
jgi:hypothetical protein